jgi:hypothetical protein
MNIIGKGPLHQHKPEEMHCSCVEHHTQLELKQTDSDNPAQREGGGGGGGKL